MKTFLHLLAACLGIVATSGPAFSQPGYPSRPVRIVVPAPAGSPPDVMARLYADQLGRSLGQPFTVENKAGASGNIGADFVAKAPADGHTIFYAYNQIATMNPHLFSRLGYHMARDLAPVTQTLSTAYVLLGNNDLPARDLAGMIEYARKNPGKVAYASYGPGTASHLVFELIQESAKVQMLHVPYKQGQVADVMGDQVAMLFEAFPSGVPLVKSGKVRGLAVSSEKRLPDLPDVPALNEAVPGLDLTGWQGAWVPAATPSDVVAKLNAEFVRITRTPEMQKRIADVASTPMTTSPQEMAAAIKRESDQWGRIIKAKNIVLD